MLNQEQIDILKHTQKNHNLIYCGDSPDMQGLVKLGFMESAGRKSFVPDEYFRLTSKGKMKLNEIQEV